MNSESTDIPENPTSVRKHVILHKHQVDWIDDNNLQLSAYLRDLINQDMETKHNTDN